MCFLGRRTDVRVNGKDSAKRVSFEKHFLVAYSLSVKFDDEGGDGRNDGVIRESYDFGGDDVISVAESLSDFRIIRPRKLLPLI